MTREAAPSFQPPHSVPRQTRAGIIPMQRAPERSSTPLKAPFNYQALFDSFFRVMQSVENGRNLFDTLPIIEEERSVPGSERVASLLSFNQLQVRELVREISKRIGGIPVRLATSNGEQTHGHITDIHDLAAGRWELTFQTFTSDDSPRLHHTAQELHEGYLAASQPQEE